MIEKEFIIEFNSISAADADRYAEELRNTLLDASNDIKVEKRRADTRSQDFGGTLVLVLAAPSVVAVAKALSDWLKLRNSASVRIKTPEGDIIGNKLTSKDAASLIAQRLQQTR